MKRKLKLHIVLVITKQIPLKKKTFSKDFAYIITIVVCKDLVKQTISGSPGGCIHCFNLFEGKFCSQCKIPLSFNPVTSFLGVYSKEKTIRVL